MPRLSGEKWGDSRQGTPGGVVTWSIVPPGASGVATGFELPGSDITVDGQDIVPFNLARALEVAFNTWSEVADIEFVQVADDGAPVTQGDAADIRVAFGEIDGEDDILAFAFFPVNQEFEGDEFEGDILFDADETFFFSFRDQFLNTAIHEIGHSIGLEHIDRNVVKAIMNPISSDATSLFADDEIGATRIYGAQDNEPPRLTLADDRANITILGELDDLILLANGLDNRIAGGAGDELIRGRAGQDDVSGGAGFDTLIGNGGDDTLFGNGASDVLKGGPGADSLNGGIGNDDLIGGGKSDTLEGRGGRDSLIGSADGDLLLGGGGGDTLIGGPGDDTLAGGRGGDVFAYRPGAFGDDVVTDFEIGADTLAFARGGAIDVAVIGADTVITARGGTVTLLDTDLSGVQEDVFLL